MAEIVQFYGTGRRKTSIARVFLRPGQGRITVNRRPFEDYFPRETLRLIVTQPLELTGTTSQLDVKVNVFVGQGLHIVEHRGDVARHADLIALGMVGLSLLHGVLDVNGEGDGSTARTHPTGA